MKRYHHFGYGNQYEKRLDLLLERRRIVAREYSETFPSYRVQLLAELALDPIRAAAFGASQTTTEVKDESERLLEERLLSFGRADRTLQRSDDLGVPFEDLLETDVDETEHRFENARFQRRPTGRIS